MVEELCPLKIQFYPASEFCALLNRAKTTESTHIIKNRRIEASRTNAYKGEGNNIHEEEISH